MGHHGDDVGVEAGDGQGEGPGAENHVGEALRQSRQVRRAEPLYKEYLAMRKEVLGDRHPDTLTSLNNLAICYKAQGRSDKATKFKETYGN